MRKPWQRTMAEFPRSAFDYYTTANKNETVVVLVKDLRLAVEAYDQLQDRFVMKSTEDSITIGNLRARLAEVDPEWKVNG